MINETNVDRKKLMVKKVSRESKSCKTNDLSC